MGAVRKIEESLTGVPCSALVALQDKLVRGHTIAESDVCEALTSDIAAGCVISETFLVKFIGHAPISEAAVRRMLLQVQSRMAGLLFTDPVVFLNYSKAAVILRNKLQPSS